MVLQLRSLFNLGRSEFNMRQYAYSQAFWLLFALLWISSLGCFKSSPERSNPLDPAVVDDPFHLQASPAYGQVRLNWERPANIANPMFNIYRQHPDSARFTFLDTTSGNHYTDDAVFKYDKNFAYQIALFSQNQNSESRRSQTAMARPYRLPKIRVGAVGRSGGFVRGIQSKLNPSRMYVLDNQFQTVKAFDLVSNQFEANSLCFVQRDQGDILNYSVAVINGVEYFLSISLKDSSLYRCKVENNFVPQPAERIVFFHKIPTAIASAAANDSLVFVAVVVSANEVEVLKINYLRENKKIIRTAKRLQTPVSFMVFNEKIKRLFLLSGSSEKVYMLDENLTALDSVNVGKAPTNLAACSDPTALFVCCQENAQIFSLKVEANALQAYQLRKGENEIFTWVDCARGEESDILFYYLVYERSFNYRVDIYRTFNGMNDASFVRSLFLEPKQWNLNEIASITYIHEIDLNRPARNLYLFSRDLVRYFVP